MYDNDEVLVDYSYYIGGTTPPMIKWEYISSENDDAFKQFDKWNGSSVTTTTTGNGWVTIYSGDDEMAAMNVIEMGKEVKIKVFVPDWDKKDFGIEIKKDLLTISGKCEKDETTYEHKEHTNTNFTKEWPVPVGSKAKASYVDGVLIVIVALPKEEQSTKVEIS